MILQDGETKCEAGMGQPTCQAICQDRPVHAWAKTSLQSCHANLVLACWPLVQHGLGTSYRAAHNTTVAHVAARRLSESIYKFVCRFNQYYFSFHAGCLCPNEDHFNGLVLFWCNQGALGLLVLFCAFKTTIVMYMDAIDKFSSWSIMNFNVLLFCLICIFD